MCVCNDVLSCIDVGVRHTCTELLIVDFCAGHVPALGLWPRIVFGLTMEGAQPELLDKWSDMKQLGNDVKLFPNLLITHESFEEWSEVKQVSTGFTSILLRHPFCVQA